MIDEDLWSQLINSSDIKKTSIEINKKYNIPLCFIVRNLAYNKYIKYTDKFYLADSIRCTRAKIYPVIIRILHKKEYSESDITYIRNRTINFYSKYLGFEQNLSKGEKKWQKWTA